MLGIELSESYFESFGRPMLENEFGGLLPFIAVGLAGSGSECLGYDDEVSRDHDFEPGFCIFIPGEDTVSRRDAFLLEKAYAKLPKEFMGFRREKLAPVGGARHGVFRIPDFFGKTVGSQDGSLTLSAWFSLPDQALLEATSGKLFFDNYGLMSSIRSRLAFFPEEVMLKKLAGRLLLMGQSGQYNYRRCIDHGETAAAQLAAFVKRGGTLIADFAPGRFDGHGKRWNNPELAKLFPACAAPLKPDFKDVPGLGRVKVGEPSLPTGSVRNFGKGKAVLLNLVFGQYHFIKLGGTGGELSTAVSADAKFQELCRATALKYLRDAKVRSDVRVLNAKGQEFPCMAVMRFDGNNRILALHVSGSEGERFDFSKAVPVTVKLREKGHVYDVRSGAYLGHTASFKTSLLPAYSRIYSIQTSATKAVGVKAPAALNAGDVMKLGFTAEGASGPQVFHVEVLDPAGRAQALYAKNCHTSGNSGELRFQLPFNAPKGVWTAAVRHVNTGLKRLHKFEVK